MAKATDDKATATVLATLLATATARPWRMDNSDDDDGNSHRYRVVTDEEDHPWIIADTNLNCESRDLAAHVEDRANAVLIATAVNHFAALVETVERLLTDDLLLHNRQDKEAVALLAAIDMEVANGNGRV